jgi:hypothetical protein
MSNLGTDFYTGFEGEPEIRFTVADRGSEERSVRLWAGYFDALMNEVQPDPGAWTALALPYHLNEGWYDSSPWRIPDLDAAIRQWMTIDALSLGPEYVAAHAAVLQVLLGAKQASKEVLIAYE